MSDQYKCPQCHGSHFKRWQLPHPIVLHWVLNPGLVFNELVLGQRIAKTALICKDCDVPVMDRSYTPCPSCSTLHLGRYSTGKHAFGNWRGIACPHCKEPIPCIWNLFSLLILAITFPLWALPYFYYFRKKPLSPLYVLENGEPPPPKPVTQKNWIIMGATWGAFMWGFMALLPAITNPENEQRWQSAFAQLPIWALGGLAFGISMWLFVGRKREDKNLSPKSKRRRVDTPPQI